MGGPGRAVKYVGCSVEGCDRKHLSRGLCSRHYAQAEYHGEIPGRAGHRNFGAPPKHVGCVVEGCERKHLAKGYCAMHRKRAERTGVVRGSEAQLRAPNVGACKVEVCERPAVTKQLCDGHYQRLRKHGDPGTKAIGNKREPGSGGRWLDHGYVMLSIPQADGTVRRIKEHRLVMEQMIGRELLPNESPHHKNGVRDDNRPENLELWAKTQPAGQRVVDLLAWAREVIERYEPIEDKLGGAA